MKLSLHLLRENTNTNTNNNNQTPLIFKAKLPLTVLNHPFLSTITTTTSNPTNTTNTSFSLSTNFPSGPSLSLSYNPSASTAVSPFSLYIKSGLGLFGSPKRSPLIFTAGFSANSNFAPVFTLHFKPQFGHFSLRKAASSTNFKPGFQSSSGSSFNSGVVSELPLVSKFKSGSSFEGSSSWEELRLEPCNVVSGNGAGIWSSDGLSGFRKDKERNGNSGIRLGDDHRGVGDVFGIVAMVKTVLPVSKRLAVKLRWGVNYYSGESRGKMPYLVVNKVGIERNEEEEVKDVRKSGGGDSEVDRELLKGMWFSTRRDMEVLEKENRELKDSLEALRRSSVSGKNTYRKSDAGGNGNTLIENSAEFERWRSKKANGEENGRKDLKKSANNTSDVESELQKAIRAASPK